MDQLVQSTLAADALNKVLVSTSIQQIDEALNQKLDHENLTQLILQLERLKALLQQVADCLEGEPTMPAVTIRSCLERTREVIQLATRIIFGSQKERRCIDFITCVPKISREIREWTATFDNLFQDLEFDLSVWLKAQQIVHEFVSLQPVPEPDVLLQPVPDSGFVGSKIKSAEAELHLWLTEAPNVRVIGVYGIPGVGKTSLLKIIYNTHKFDSSVFELVIWVTVSQDYTILDLQCRIGESIDLELSKSGDLDIRKMKLYARLKKKKFLLILDGAQCPLDQQEVGVGFGEDIGSKVVFSTRNRDLALMEAEESIEMQSLSRDEGWEMFQRIAFKGGHVPEELKGRARIISDECAGLPAAISVVAGAMRGKTTIAIDEWNRLAFEKCRAFFSTYFESYNLLVQGNEY